MEQKTILALFIGILMGGAIAGTAMHAVPLLFQPKNEGACLNGHVQPVFCPTCDDELLALVQSANSAIQVEVYVFSYERLADALISAKNRGVDVRVIMEPRLEQNPNLRMMEYLRRNGINARWATLDFSRTHSKIIIVDGKSVLVGSINWSRSALLENREAGVIIYDEKIARMFSDMFEEDWEKARAKD